MLSGVEYMQARVEKLRAAIIAEYGEKGRAFIQEIDRRNQAEMERNERYSEKSREQAVLEAERYNAQEGNRQGIDCPACKNRGYIAVPKRNAFVLRECDCMKARRAGMLIQKSGLAAAIEECRLDNFERWAPHAQIMLDTALRYLSSESGWLFMGGQVGCGKTHICTAVCGELLRRGEEVRYMLWRDEAARLKGLLNSDEYALEMWKLKSCDVLYIDDFWKGEKGKRPTTGDIHLAFELLNSRYAARKKTILSCEYDMNGLLQIDEATGSRIYERTKGFRVEISPGKEKNWRLKA